MFENLVLIFFLFQKEKDKKLTPKTEDTETSTVPNPACATLPSPAYSNQPMNSPAYTNQPVNSPAYSVQTPNTPQTYPNIATPPTPYQYVLPHTPGTLYAATPSPALPQQGGSFPNSNMSSSAPPQNQYGTTPMPSPAPSVPAQTYPHQTHQSGHNFMASSANMTQQQQNQQQFPHFNHHHQQNMAAHHQMYNQMMSHQQMIHHHHNHHQRYPGLNYGNGGAYPQHICGHFAAVHLPPSALQLPCPSCQARSGSGMSDATSYQNWQLGGHYQYNPQMSGGVGQSFNYMNHHYGGGNHMLNYSQAARDIQCGDVSQSTQSLGKNKSISTNNNGKNNSSSTKPKSPKEHKNEKISTKVNNSQSIPAVPPVSETVNTVNNTVNNGQTVNNGTKVTTEKQSENPNKESPDSKNNYMKQDTYQRTLEYVQQCQNWNTNVVKDEVTSTTDQKPSLNPNGTVCVPNSSVIESMTAPAVVPQYETTNEFVAPVNLMSEAPNMVLNNLTSSLNSLQQENKYFQMLQ